MVAQSEALEQTNKLLNERKRLMASIVEEAVASSSLQVDKEMFSSVSQRQMVVSINRFDSEKLNAMFDDLDLLNSALAQAYSAFRNSGGKRQAQT